MSASLIFSKQGLENIIHRMTDPEIKQELEYFPKRKAVVALVAQAIADNFDKEGPGWAPLKAETIRNSVAKKLKAKLASMTDKELLRYEQRVRKSGTKESEEEPNRRILQRTGLLKKSVTTPGSKNNVWKVDGSNLIWGTDLVYAGIHNRGMPSKHIPKREFLTIRQEWMTLLNDYLVKETFKIIIERVTKGNT